MRTLNNYLRPADSVKAVGYFFMREKYLLGPFKGFFMEIETFLISMKNPEKWLIICFAQIEKR